MIWIRYVIGVAAAVFVVAAVLAVVATRGRTGHNEMAANMVLSPTVATAPPDGADLAPFAPSSSPESDLSD